MYRDRISFELAKEISDLWITTDQYYDKYENIGIPWDYFYGDIPAPTYGEVFDWFMVFRGICITLDPFFTYAFMGSMGYTWKISYVDECDDMKTIKEEDVWNSSLGFGGSFNTTADAAIEYALTLGDRRVKYIEVDVDEL